jgi:type IV secretion system protein VirB6
MSACEVLTAEASAGVAAALRAVDCLAGETVASAFARLFGDSAGGGALLPALTIGLTLYIAVFAIGLLTGRTRLGVSALTPRMLTLGLVLTFATSWVAYSQVVWNLTTGAPDEIAGVLTGTKGSATEIFGNRIDMVFGAIAEAAEAGKQAAQANAAAAQQGAQATGQVVSGNFTPTNLMWLGALLLLLGTVGVLVTARIALAVLLAVGPIFVVFALFSGTRGLFVGWLRGLTLTAVTPLFVVVGGDVVLELLVPIVAALHGVEGVNGRAALALFVIACVHVALMSMVFKVGGTMVAAWQVFGLAEREREPHCGDAAVASYAAAPLMTPLSPTATASAGGRAAAMIPAASVEVVSAHGGGSPAGAGVASRTQITQVTGGASAGLPPLPRSRARGIGSRFAAPQNRAGGLIR